MTTSDTTFMTLNSDSSSIVDAEMMEKIKKRKLSASTISGLEGCQTRWAAGSVVGKVVELPADNPASRGSMFHKVMEDFFALPADSRTMKNMKSTVDKVLASKEFAVFQGNTDAILWLRDAINGYYSMGGQPQDVRLARVKNQYGKMTNGIEVSVGGKISDTKRNITGFVDQIFYSGIEGREDQLVVQDWKTSQEPKRWAPGIKYDKGWAEQRQGIIYTMLLENMGYTVSGAGLVYPIPEDFVGIKIHNEELRERVREEVVIADKTLDTIIETNEMNYSPGPLCCWCPLVKICPAAFDVSSITSNSDTVKNMKKNFEEQPDGDSLRSGFMVRG